jgi:hypothetical protein
MLDVWGGQAARALQPRQLPDFFEIQTGIRIRKIFQNPAAAIAIPEAFAPRMRVRARSGSRLAVGIVGDGNMPPPDASASSKGDGIGP